MVYESTQAGYRTASANGTVTALEALQYISKEYILNGTVRLSKALSMGLNTHWIERNQFGIKGSAMEISAGLRYETPNLGVAIGSKYLNAPIIHYSNGAKGTTQYASLHRRKIPGSNDNSF